MELVGGAFFCWRQNKYNYKLDKNTEKVKTALGGFSLPLQLHANSTNKLPTNTDSTNKLLDKQEEKQHRKTSNRHIAGQKYDENIRKDTKNSVFSFIDVPILVVIDKLTWF